MPRFVILRHAAPWGLHWDLMLEVGAVLKTWALAEQPARGKTIVAQSLPDHRLAYLDYEGPVSGDRGAAERFDHGEYEPIEMGHRRLAVRLFGDRCQGLAELTAGDGPDNGWQFHFSGCP